MRVALFFDGKNFYSGLKDQAPKQIIDFNKVSKWLVQQVEGSHLWGAYYYTGIETGSSSKSDGQTKLAGFLDMLELQPGFFVKRFPRKVHSFKCSTCNAVNMFTTEKEIDTTMAADMLRLAAVDAFDIMVLMSGDADHTPAIEGVRAIGKQAYVATWGRTGLSARIRKSAFDHIDLLDGLKYFGNKAGVGNAPDFDDNEIYNEEHNFVDEQENQKPVSAKDNTDSPDGVDISDGKLFVEELKRAENNFETGYVGMNYFLKRWQSDGLSNEPDDRRKIMDALVLLGQVEVYEAEDGHKAIKSVS